MSCRLSEPWRYETAHQCMKKRDTILDNLDHRDSEQSENVVKPDIGWATMQAAIALLMLSINDARILPSQVKMILGLGQRHGAQQR